VANLAPLKLSQLTNDLLPWQSFSPQIQTAACNTNFNLWGTTSTHYCRQWKTAWNNMSSLWEREGCILTYHFHRSYYMVHNSCHQYNSTKHTGQSKNTKHCRVTPILSIIRHSSSFTPSATVHFSTCIYWQQ